MAKENEAKTGIEGKAFDGREKENLEDTGARPREEASSWDEHNFSADIGKWDVDRGQGGDEKAPPEKVPPSDSEKSTVSGDENAGTWDTTEDSVNSGFDEAMAALDIAQAANLAESMGGVVGEKDTDADAIASGDATADDF